MCLVLMTEKKHFLAASKKSNWGKTSSQYVITGAKND